MTAHAEGRTSGGRLLPGDRRGPRRGDRRRSALLRSLDVQLRDGSLDAVNVADISRRAGVTRSAFYFYFENKAVAVAALLAEFYDDAFLAAEVLQGTGTPAERIDAAIRGVFGSWERHRHVYAAMLDARAESAAVREMWDADREAFVPVVADLIRSEREAGRAVPGPDETVLATALLDLVDRSVERLARGGDELDGRARERQAEAVVTIWLRTIYGRTDDGTDEGGDA